MFQIAHRHLVWFTGLTCDELSAKVPRTNQRSKCKISNTTTKKKKKTKPILWLGAFGPSNKENLNGPKGKKRKRDTESHARHPSYKHHTRYFNTNFNTSYFNTSNTLVSFAKIKQGKPWGNSKKILQCLFWLQNFKSTHFNILIKLPTSNDLIVFKSLNTS